MPLSEVVDVVGEGCVTAEESLVVVIPVEDVTSTEAEEVLGRP